MGYRVAMPGSHPAHSLPIINNWKPIMKTEELKTSVVWANGKDGSDILEPDSSVITGADVECLQKCCESKERCIGHSVAK